MYVCIYIHVHSMYVYILYVCIYTHVYKFPLQQGSFHKALIPCGVRLGIWLACVKIIVEESIVIVAKVTNLN